jgi:hypothetical protein
MPRGAALALLLLALPPALAAQTGSVAVRLAVVTDALSIARTADLDFGPVLPGVATTVNSRTGVNAGEFEVRGARRADFTATFTLPVALTVGPYWMPITFNAQSGCQDPNDKGSCKFFDPRVPFAGRINNKAAPQNTFFFRIGGTVTPAVGQHPGVYRGTIALQVAYTGS